MLYEEFHSVTEAQRKVIRDNNFTYRHILKFINKYLDKESINVLDIGCGVGTLAFYLAKRGKRVTGIDISKNAIDACLINSKKLKLEKHTKFNVSNFPNENINGRFDFIIFTEVIEHLPNDNKALKEIYKILKKNGYLILTTPSKYAPLYRLNMLKSFDERVGHLRRYDLQELIKKAERIGFSTIESEKVEGIMRNFLFTNNLAGKLVRFINKLNLSDFVTVVDNISLNLFGGSNYIIIFKKS